METSQYTPGPWAISVWAEGLAFAGEPAHIYTEADDYSEADICEFESDELPLEERVANANLIAAAPDLLEACEVAAKQLIAMHAQLDNALGLEPSSNVTAMYLEDVIAKAKGEQT